MTSSAERARIAAELQRVDFDVKVTVNTNKDKRVGVEEAITQVELLGEETKSSPEDFKGLPSTTEESK